MTEKVLLIREVLQSVFCEHVFDIQLVCIATYYMQLFYDHPFEGGRLHDESKREEVALSAVLKHPY